MTQFFSSPLGVVIISWILNSAGLFVSIMVHKGKAKIEDETAQVLPQQDVEGVSEILDVVERITEAAVQDANSRIVIGLKQNNLFTKETAESLKQSVIKDVLVNLGPLQEKAVSLLGPLENIVGQLVEKYVLQGKDQVNQLVQTKTTA